MQTEIEAKWLDIDAIAFRKKLKELKAELVLPERLMRRKNYDYADSRLEKIGGWVRVRDEGNKVTLSYKQLNDRTLHGTKEVGLTVDDFDAACSFLESIGLVNKSYQETKRESWQIGKSAVEIDTWPWIPTFVEIESADEKTLQAVAKKLGLDWPKAIHGSVETAYQAYYEATEHEIDSWSSITFSPIPAWLKKKTKT